MKHISRWLRRVGLISLGLSLMLVGYAHAGISTDINYYFGMPFIVVTLIHGGDGTWQVAFPNVASLVNDRLGGNGGLGSGVAFLGFNLLAWATILTACVKVGPWVMRRLHVTTQAVLRDWARCIRNNLGRPPLWILMMFLALNFLPRNLEAYLNVDLVEPYLNVQELVFGVPLVWQGVIAERGLAHNAFVLDYGLEAFFYLAVNYLACVVVFTSIFEASKAVLLKLLGKTLGRSSKIAANVVQCPSAK